MRETYLQRISDIAEGTWVIPTDDPAPNELGETFPMGFRHRQGLGAAGLMNWPKRARTTSLGCALIAEHPPIGDAPGSEPEPHQAIDVMHL